MISYLTRRDLLGAAAIAGIGLCFSTSHVNAQRNPRGNQIPDHGKDIFSILKQDHLEFRKTLQRMEKAPDTRTRSEEFAQLRLSLLPHMKAEEVILYPAMEHQPVRLKGEEEHHLMERVVIEMKNLAPSEERWTAKLSVLRDLLDHHLLEEEGTMFKRARAHLSKNQAMEMAERFRTMKQELRSAVQ